VPTDWYALRMQERAAIAANPAQVAALRALYDAEIAYVDHELGRLIAAARAAAPPGGLMIVVTADHGEPMGEHGHFWFRDLHDETLHVPLVMLPPPRVVFSPRVVREQVRLIDVAPTILEWAGLPKLAHADGVSLAKLAAANAADAAPPPLVAVWEPHASEATAPAFAVRRLDWKLIESEPGFWAPDRWLPGARELFAVGTDPGEQMNVASSHPAELEELTKLLPAEFKLAEPASIDPNLREDLRALGYMQ
jgi:arylsulfatase A-like enzyme